MLHDVLTLFSNMADYKALFACLISRFPTVYRQRGCNLRAHYLGRRLFAVSSIHRKEKEETCTNMFDFFHKNPEHLKRRQVGEIQFDVEQAVAVEKEKAERRPQDVEPEKATWSEGCKRVGAIGVKLGMMPLWLKNGQRVPVTLVQVIIVYRSGSYGLIGESRQ